jgi:cysteine-rich repeat protein
MPDSGNNFGKCGGPNSCTCRAGFYTSDGNDGVSQCTQTVCGDGFVTGVSGETCDDGNTVDGDGCNGQCKLEEAVAGFSRTLGDATAGSIPTSSISGMTVAQVAEALGVLPEQVRHKIENAPPLRPPVILIGVHGWRRWQIDSVRLNGAVVEYTLREYEMICVLDCKNGAKCLMQSSKPVCVCSPVRPYRCSSCSVGYSVDITLLVVVACSSL